MIAPFALPKGKRVLCIFSILVGVVLSYFGADNYLYWSHFEKIAIKTSGTITSFSQSTSNDSSGNHYEVYTPIFSFTAEDGSKQLVKGNLSDRNPSDRLGDVITVIYERDHPKDARIYRFREIYSSAALLGALALLFILFGSIPLISHHFRNNRIQWLIDNGMKVEAPVLRVLFTNIRHSFFTVLKVYTIEAQWLDPNSGHTYRFSSRKNGFSIFKDPTSQLPKTITVLIDRNDPGKNYVMDLSFLR